MEKGYIHGVSDLEQDRLISQAKFLSMVHDRIDLSTINHLLEIGSGVGAQSEIILRNYPSIQLTAVEISEKQAYKANQFLSSQPFDESRYKIINADINDISNDNHQQFDGAYFCWILEHIEDPLRTLMNVKSMLTPNSIVYCTEVMNKSLYLDPVTKSIKSYWSAFNQFQSDKGGDPNVGPKLGKLLNNAGYKNIETWTNYFHCDKRTNTEKELMFEYWKTLLLSGSDELLKSGYVDQQLIDRFKSDMEQLKENKESIFYYAHIQARALS